MEGGQNSFGIASPIQIAIDEDYVKQRIDELIQERLDRRLDKEWLGMNDMEYLLSLEARWITRHIANHPIVQMNGWAKKLVMQLIQNGFS